MVKRYPHTAVITLQSGDTVKGEWIPGTPSEKTIKGSYFSSNSGNQVKLNPDGRECVVHGEFSTREKPVPNAVRIRIDSLGIDSPIICWDPFQTHSVIYI